MYCTQCGAQNNETARFCMKCGARLTPAVAPPESLPARRPGTWIMVLGSLAVVVAVTLGGWWFYGQFRAGANGDVNGETLKAPVEGVSVELIPTGDRPSPDSNSSLPSATSTPSIATLPSSPTPIATPTAMANTPTTAPSPTFTPMPLATATPPPNQLSLMTQLGQDRFTSVAFSPDGQILATAAQDGTVKLWDLTNGTELSTLFTPVDSNMAFSPDGNTLASASRQFRSDEVILWDVATGQELRTLNGEMGGVESIVFAPNGATLAAASRKGTLRLWRVNDWQEINTFEGNTFGVSRIALSPDGRLAAITTGEGTVKLWDIVRGTELNTLGKRGSGVRSIAFSPDGRILAAGGEDADVKLWDIASGQELQTLKAHSTQVMSVVFAPNGRTLASASYNGTVKLWDLTSGLVLHSLNGHTRPILSLLFSPDGLKLASVSDDRAVKLWDVSTGQELESWSVPVPVAADGATFSPDGGLLATAVSHNISVQLWRVPLEFAPETVSQTATITMPPPALAATTTAPVAALRDSISGSTAFQEDFSDQQAFPGLWQSVINEGMVTIGSGTLSLSSHASTTFPYVRVRENPFPAAGDFSVEIELQYTEVSNFGTGIVLGASAPENGRPAQAEPDPNFELLKVWQDNSYYNALVVGTFDKVIASLPGPDTERHTVRFLYTGGQIQVYLDGELVGQEPESTVRPTTLWFGNPYRTPQPGSWSELRIYSVSIEPENSPPPVTPAASPTTASAPTATATSPCSQEPLGEFRTLWKKHKEQLGCPIQTEPLIGDFVEQPFEGGHMYWYAQIDRVIITLGETQGNWILSNEDWDDSGSPESCSMQAPPGKFQPVRGFGWIWCQDQSIREKLGWALDIERAFPPGTDLIQGFENGIIFRDSDGRTNRRAYVMFGQDQGAFVRESYE